ncbi:MAG TPA: isoaspartyl peptidase/L-asparaginase [Steroidobacteraceae bacterium]|nr:isoaspartyl peptidase/L-asparaginase [Steroidobacteraceae bacterium]
MTHAADRNVAMALHGGAGAVAGHDYTDVIAHMRELIHAGRDQLLDGAAAIDVATATVAALEASGLYIAGRGSSANLADEYELDACLMNGATGEAGAVAALQGFASPIEVARAVMKSTPHVLLAGTGAARFAAEQGLEAFDDPRTWFTPACTFESHRLPAHRAHGTVGCVVLDSAGRLAAATSTGGVFGKLPGRVGDSPLIGAGTWADSEVAVSCTGHGEFFIRAAAAVQVAHRMRFGGASLDAAVNGVLEEISAHGGSGGLIAIDRHGHVNMSCKATGMKRAALLRDGSIVASAP